VLAASLAVVAAISAGCSDGAVGSASSTTGPTGPSNATSSTGTTRVPVQDRVVLRGTAQLDGSPLDADVVGAVVRDGGLVTACQVDLPPVSHGQYEMSVYGAGEGNGCGHPGTEIILWTFAHDQRIFSPTTLPWPASNSTTMFDPTFSTLSPAGPMSPATELAGEVYNAEGDKVEPGGRVEAFVGHTLCGLSTVRESGDFVGFSMSVVGPEAVPGCDRNAPITFFVDGHRAAEMLTNDASLHRSFDLTLS
jgi:hypothetical protein